MRITDIEIEHLAYPVPRPMWNAKGWRPATRPMLLVRVHTDEGLTGVAEAALTVATPSVLAALVREEIGGLVRGMDPLAVEAVWRRVLDAAGSSSRAGLTIVALSAIDVALWDIRGKAANLPVATLLGGFRDRVPAYASAGFYHEGQDVSELADEMRAYVDQGFRALKMKVGGLPVREDLRRVEAVLAAVGDEIPLAIDANNALAPKEGLGLARALEGANILWLEEPVATEDVAGSALIAAGTSIPIAGYETEHALAGFRELIARRAVDIVQPDVALTGGFTGCRKVAALAEAWNLPCVPHAFTSALTLVANLHFVASIPNGRFLEFDRTPNALRDELLLEPISIDADGRVAVPTGPGLGVTLNPDTIARYRVPW